MRIKPKAGAKAAAWASGIIYSLCALAIIYFPDLALPIAQSWFHGVDVISFETADITLSSFTTGLVTSMLSAWLAGYLIAGFYNFFSHASSR